MTQTVKIMFSRSFLLITLKTIEGESSLPPPRATWGSLWVAGFWIISRPWWDKEKYRNCWFSSLPDALSPTLIQSPIQSPIDPPNTLFEEKAMFGFFYSAFLIGLQNHHAPLPTLFLFPSPDNHCDPSHGHVVSPQIKWAIITRPSFLVESSVYVLKTQKFWFSLTHVSTNKILWKFRRDGNYFRLWKFDLEVKMTFELSLKGCLEFQEEDLDLGRISQTVCASGWLGGSLKHGLLSLDSRDRDSVVPGWGPRIYLLNNFPMMLMQLVHGPHLSISGLEHSRERENGMRKRKDLQICQVEEK